MMGVLNKAPGPVPLAILAAGILIVDSEARVRFANAAAREIAAAGDVLVLSDGTVRPRQREQRDTFQRLVGASIAGRSGGPSVRSG